PYLPPQPTFTDIALTPFFPQPHHVPYPTIPHSIHPPANPNLHFPLLPLHNPIHPSLNITLHYLLHHHPLFILPQITLPIHQHLLLHPHHQANSKQLYPVHSHPHP
ncbi:prephenate dehydratase domain-containing protein, partial [Bacillus mycoides]|uniref:prephenate dehydratase domain-containing protein n=1 Tax=Bacillus mycoides TaxID=1405 RepID=UPI003CC7F191